MLAPTASVSLVSSHSLIISKLILRCYKNIWMISFDLLKVVSKCHEADDASCSLGRSEATLDLLKRDEHDDVPTAKTHEVGGEALVEGKWAFVLEHRGDETERGQVAANRDVHGTCLQHIDGRAYDARNESSAKSAADVHKDVVWHADLQEHLLELIICGELGRVNDGIAKNVGAPADPETLHAVLSESFLVAVHRARVGALCGRKTSLSLHAHLNEISWVSHRNAESTRCQTSSDLLAE